jgi:hypothetical protein
MHSTKKRKITEKNHATKAAVAPPRQHKKSH